MTPGRLMESSAPVWERIAPSLVKEVTSDRGSFAAYQPKPSAWVFRGRGHLSIDHVRLIPQVLDPHIGEGKSVAIYYDCEAMTGFDADARHLAIKWGVAHRRRLLTIDILIGGSRVVVVGIAAASTAMRVVGVTMHTHMNRSNFENVLSRALA